MGILQTIRACVLLPSEVRAFQDRMETNELGDPKATAQNQIPIIVHFCKFRSFCIELTISKFGNLRPIEIGFVGVTLLGFTPLVTLDESPPKLEEEEEIGGGGGGGGGEEGEGEEEEEGEEEGGGRAR
ncbi:hypothetical protein V1478_017042 [Vespula squamosa]|uniref:Uncharacterized protein n=1 Tax=Vespula squamosa TaxID=30214 RepID=A0ABD1ZY97_VESSQ